MKYKVEYSKEALDFLKKADKSVAKLLVSWISKNLDGCSYPKLKGKPLSANRSGQWRYRVGDYRILTIIKDDKLIILVIAIGHRKNIYL